MRELPTNLIGTEKEQSTNLTNMLGEQDALSQNVLALHPQITLCKSKMPENVVTGFFCCLVQKAGLKQNWSCSRENQKPLFFNSAYTRSWSGILQ